jgi:hypothetical protein
MQDCCFDSNNKCKLTRESGKSNTYSRIDEKCKWEVRVCRRTSPDVTRLMYVSTLHDEHRDFCTLIDLQTERKS